MREFIVTGHEVPTAPDFSLDDITGGAGRLDVLSRCVTAALLLSHDIREDVRVRLVFRDAITVRFEGSRLRRLNPDERSTAALIRDALADREEAVGRRAAETSPGVLVSRLGFKSTLADAADGGTVVHLDQSGEPVADVPVPADPVFVLSDHVEFTDRETKLVDEAATETVRLGPESLHADQAITVAHNYLDTEGFRQY